MRNKQSSFARTIHDLGLGIWLGGSLMGAVGLNRASAEPKDPSERGRVANAGWSKWTPINLAGIAAYVLGGMQLMRANKGRLAAQQGVGSMTLAKNIVTGVAFVATGYARVLGQQVMKHGDVPVEDATTPLPETPEEVAQAQRRLKILQWAIPAHVAALIALNAKMGEQQRPMQVISGMLERVRPAA